MPLARALASRANCDLKLVVEQEISGNRRDLGWSSDVNSPLDLQILSEKNWAAEIRKIVTENPDAIYLVGGYQRLPKFRYLIKQVGARNGFIGILAEAPLNMEQGMRRFAKAFYLRTLLPLLSRNVIRKSKFLANLSGGDNSTLAGIGWPTQKIYPFGYFPEGKKVSLCTRDSRRFSVLSLGYLHHYKGNHILLEALAKCRAEDVECHIVGDGPERAFLENRAKRLGIKSRVFFHGFLSDGAVCHQLSQTDVMICPGLYEPWGIRINEALLSCIPVITSDGLGASELVKVSGGGELFQAGNSHLLACIIKSIIHEPERLPVYRNRIDGYRSKITPEAAATHLLAIIKHNITGTGTQPVPPWSVASKESIR